MRGFRHLAWPGLVIVSLCVSALAQSTKERWAAKLPEGEGKALVEEVCVQCHSLESTVLQQKDRSGWQKTVNDMILRGAFITPTEAETIVAYLSRVLGHRGIDVNHASLDELLQGTPLQPAEAEAILDYRNRHGPFRSIEDLKKIKALTPERFQKVKDYLSVLPLSSSPPSESKPN